MKRIYYWATPEIKFRPFHIGYHVIDDEWIEAMLKEAFINPIRVKTLEELYAIRGLKIAIPYNASEFKHGNLHRHRNETEEAVHVLSYMEKLKTPLLLFQNSSLKEKYPVIQRRLEVNIEQEAIRFSRGPDFIYVPFTLSDADFHEIAKDRKRAIERLSLVNKVLDIIK